MKILFDKLETLGRMQSPTLIKGAVYKNGIPVSCQVRAYSRITGRLLSRGISSSIDGSYVLFGLKQSPNYVLAIDPDEQFNIAAQDNVK